MKNDGGHGGEKARVSRKERTFSRAISYLLALTIGIADDCAETTEIYVLPMEFASFTCPVGTMRHSLPGSLSYKSSDVRPVASIIATSTITFSQYFQLVPFFHRIVDIWSYNPCLKRRHAKHTPDPDASRQNAHLKTKHSFEGELESDRATTRARSTERVAKGTTQASHRIVCVNSVVRLSRSM
jgi:hypothetical protein